MFFIVPLGGVGERRLRVAPGSAHKACRTRGATRAVRGHINLRFYANGSGTRPMYELISADFQSSSSPRVPIYDIARNEMAYRIPV